MQLKKKGVQYGLRLRREEVNYMEKLTNGLLSELNCNTAFTIPIGKGIEVRNRWWLHGESWWF